MTRAGLLTAQRDRNSGRSWRAAAAAELQAIADVAIAFLASRALVYLFAWMAHLYLTPSAVAFLPETQTGLPWWLDWGAHWDGLWYLDIATNGYRLAGPPGGSSESNVAFWPLYPALLRGAVFLMGWERLALSALVLSNLFLFFGLYAFHRLVSLDGRRDLARRAVFCVALFPTSFFYSAYYPESLFLLTASAAMYAARRGRSWTAGAWGALAALTHTGAGLLLFPLAMELAGGAQQGARRRLASVKGLVLMPLAGLGFVAYLALTVGQPLAFLTGAQGWGHHPAWPWQDLLAVWEWVSPWGKRDAREIVPLVSAYGALLVFGLSVGWLRRSYLLWAGLLLLLFLSLPAVQPLISMGRYVLQLLPLFIVLAVWGSRRWVHRLILAAFLPGLGVLTALFARWHWVG